MYTSQQKQLITDIIAAVNCAVMGFVMLMGLTMAKLDIDSTPLRVSAFTDEQHIDIIASAFGYELAEGETLRVAPLSLGIMHGITHLKVIIDNVESVESFLSRYNGELKETEITQSFTEMSIYSPGVFEVYALEAV